MSPVRRIGKLSPLVTYLLTVGTNKKAGGCDAENRCGRNRTLEACLEEGGAHLTIGAWASSRGCSSETVESGCARELPAKCWRWLWGRDRDFTFYPQGVRLTGIDLSPDMLEIARKKADELGLDADLREGNAQELPFADASFDTVVCTFPVQHTRRSQGHSGDEARASPWRKAPALGPCQGLFEGVVGCAAGP